MPPPRRGGSALVLVVIAGGAAVLRFARLGAKPLWLDEAMTALVTMGRGPADVPIGRELSTRALRQIFTVNPASSAATTIARLRDPLVQHTHPPLFYLVLRGWFWLTNPDYTHLAWQARIVPSILGLVGVFAIFALARLVASTRAALLAAALTAVSPLMVMIAREARNYTLPLLCVAATSYAVAMLADDIANRRVPRTAPWLLLTIGGIAGCYGHYFAAIAFAAQVTVVAWLAVRARAGWTALAAAGAAAAVLIAFAPWLPTFVAHARSPEQEWMREANPIVYVYHTLSAWQAMVQGWVFDVYEPQAAWKAVRIAIGVPILAMVAVEVRRTLRSPNASPGLRALAATCALTIVLLWAACTVERKDLMSEYRYHFAYYPALIVLVGASLERARGWIAGVVLALGVAHSVCLDAGWEFPQLTRPAEVGAVLAAATEPPALIAVGEASFHETVNAVTFVLAFEGASPAAPRTRVVFVRRSDSYPTFAWSDADPAIFWTRLAGVSVERAPRTMWVWASSMLPADYRASFRIGTSPLAAGCSIDPREGGRTIGDDDPPRGPFRRYRCL